MASRRAYHRYPAGLIIAGIAVLVLDVIWAALLPYYLGYHWAIVVGLVASFFVTGLILRIAKTRVQDRNEGKAASDETDATSGLRVPNDRPQDR